MTMGIENHRNAEEYSQRNISVVRVVVRGGEEREGTGEAGERERGRCDSHSHSWMVDGWCCGVSTHNNTTK